MSVDNSVDWVWTSPTESVSLVRDPRWDFLGTDDLSYGNPVPVARTVESLLWDGDLVEHDRDGNRTVVFNVMVKGSDSKVLAQNQEAFARLMRAATTATYTPPDGIGERSVFDVLVADPQYVTSDLDEVRHRALYRVEATCAPYVRSAEPVTVSAPAEPDLALTVIADGTSATGWTNATAGTGGAAGLLLTSGNFQQSGGNWSAAATATRTFSPPIDASATPYFAVDVSPSYGWSGSPTQPYGPTSASIRINGVLYPATTTPVAGSGLTRYIVFAPGITSLSTLSVSIGTGSFATSSLSGTAATFSFDNVTRSATMPFSLPFQRTFSTPLSGSMRTPVEIKLTRGVKTVDAGGTVPNLNGVIVYTSPRLGAGGYTPSLSPFASTSGTASPTNMVSGRYWTGTTGVAATFNVPAASLPQGQYALWARLSCSATTGTRKVSWAAGSDSGSAYLDMTQGTAGLFSLGSVMLPTTLIENPLSSDLITVTIGGVDSGTLTVDEAWLFHMRDPYDTATKAGLTVCTVGAESLVLEPATFANGGRSRLLTSDAAGLRRVALGRSSIKFWADHQFVPPTAKVFTVNSGVFQNNGTQQAGQSLDATYYPMHHARVA